jgi:hypothetical protein
MREVNYATAAMSVKGLYNPKQSPEATALAGSREHQSDRLLFFT